MHKVKVIILLILLFEVLPVISNAEPVVWTSGSYEIRNDNEWHHIIELQTYNDVTVKMFEATSVNQFSMYNNSELTTHGGTIDNLDLYNNANASFLGGTIFNLTIHPEFESGYTGLIKLYAYDNVTYFPYNPYGEGTLMGYWLNVPGGTFNITLRGEGAYDHVQIVPEPATFTLLALGSLALLSRQKQNV